MRTATGFALLLWVLWTVGALTTRVLKYWKYCARRFNLSQRAWFWRACLLLVVPPI